MKNLIISAFACLVVALSYSMNDNEVSEEFGNITYRTYENFCSLAEWVQTDIGNIYIGDFEGQCFHLAEIDKDIVLNRNHTLSEDDIQRRYPWNIKGSVNRVAVYTAESGQEIKAGQESAFSLFSYNNFARIAGPNIHGYASVFDEIVDTGKLQNDAQRNWVARLFKRKEEQPRVYDVLAIHPYKNMCVSLKSFGGLELYDIDANRLQSLKSSYDIPWHDELNVAADFGSNNRLFIVYDGKIRIYSTEKPYDLIETISFQQYIDKPGFVTREHLVEKCTEARRNSSDDYFKMAAYNPCVKDIVYSFEYPNYLLCCIKFEYFVMEGDTVVVLRASPSLTPYELSGTYYGIYDLITKKFDMLPIGALNEDKLQGRQESSTWYWDKPVELYRLRSMEELHAQKSIKTVSLLATNRADFIKDVILASAAYNWLNNEKRTRKEGKRILREVRTFDHKYTLLWNTQYEKNGERTNLFKEVWKKLKKK